MSTNDSQDNPVKQLSTVWRNDFRKKCPVPFNDLTEADQTTWDVYSAEVITKGEQDVSGKILESDFKSITRVSGNIMIVKTGADEPWNITASWFANGDNLSRSGNVSEPLATGFTKFYGALRDKRNKAFAEGLSTR